MRKLVCLLAVLALAAGASAADIVIYDGVFYLPYVSGPQPPYEVYPLLWYNWLFDHTHPVDGLASARAQGSGWKTVRTDGATSTYAPPTTLSLAGNRYIEFDAYFFHGNSRIEGTGTTPIYRKGVKFDSMHLQVNSDTGWTYKWDTGVDMWVDDVYYSNMGAWAADPNTWVHIKIDLLSNSAPAAQIDLDNDTVGLLRFNFPVSPDFHVRNAQFTGAGSANIAPSVNAGEDQLIMPPVCEAVLNGSVTDDGLPDPPAQVSSTWDMVTGPAAVVFGNVNLPTTTATFSAVGVYTLSLTASDGELTGSDTVLVEVLQNGDLTGDSFVNLDDFAVIAEWWLEDCNASNQWCDHADFYLSGDVAADDLSYIASHWLAGDYLRLGQMIWVYIDDPGVLGQEGFSGYMSKYETTNVQYCQFLNAALTSGDIVVDGNCVYGASGSNPGADFPGQLYYKLAYAGYTYDQAANGGAAAISYNGSTFTVGIGLETHPVTCVSWYGAAAFCNYYGWTLPTEWQWQAVADYDGSYTYACGTTIDNNIANYRGSAHPYGTTAVDQFGAYGYGICDMAGNVWEWTSSLWNPEYNYRVLRGGGWYAGDDACTVSDTCYYYLPHFTSESMGFRVCR